MIRIAKGLNLPIEGAPEQTIENATAPKSVALNGPDYVGMKPTMHVKVGDSVKMGQKVFECKRSVGVVYTAPASGKVVAINRGERRSFQNVVIELDGTGNDQVEFSSYLSKDFADYSADELKNLLVESGQWTALRTRPFSNIAPVNGDAPSAIFITAIDTNPLAADPRVIIDEHREDFRDGVAILSKLTEGNTYVCKAPNVNLGVTTHAKIVVKDFGGVHPAGLVGTHIHFLEPVSANKTVWHIGYQDVIAVAKLVKSGKLWNERIVSVAGPQVSAPKLYRTRVGADINSLVDGKMTGDTNRVISGSVLHGRTLCDTFKFLGRYNLQVSVIREDSEREFLGWHSPGFNKFSLKRIFVSKMMPNKLFNFGTSTHGSARAIVPIGMFEQVMPLDILPTQLLKALVCKDTDYAQALGALELDEEDLSLCTFASPGKTDFGPILRENLTTIEKEG